MRLFDARNCVDARKSHRVDAPSRHTGILKIGNRPTVELLYREPPYSESLFKVNEFFGRLKSAISLHYMKPLYSEPLHSEYIPPHSDAITCIQSGEIFHLFIVNFKAKIRSLASIFKSLLYMYFKVSFEMEKHIIRPRPT